MFWFVFYFKMACELDKHCFFWPFYYCKIWKIIHIFTSMLLLMTAYVKDAILKKETHREKWPSA